MALVVAVPLLKLIASLVKRMVSILKLLRVVVVVWADEPAVPTLCP